MQELFLTHYYNENIRPLKSISECKDTELSEIVAMLSQKQGKAYNRFRNFDWYIEQRKNTEKWLRDEFIKHGGTPQRQSPLYFVLGNSDYLEFCYGEQAKSIQLSFECVKEKDISFTLTDSIAMFLDGTNIRIFTKQTLMDYFNNENHSIEEYIIKSDSEHIYIEAQLWCDEYFSNE